MSHDIQLVCLDLGGVCIRIAESWAHACQRVGFDPDTSKLADAAADIQRLSFAHETGRMDSQAFCIELAAMFSVDQAMVSKALDAYLVEPFEGITELMHELAAADVATACLSNTNDRHWQMMHGDVTCSVSLPLDRLTHRFVSHEIGAMKPNDAIYEHVEQASGIAPASIVFFDDLPANITAATKRGWQGLLIDPAADPASQIRAFLQRANLLG